MAAPETPNSRKETYYDSILKDGDTGLTPNSREEMYLDAIDRDLDDIRAEVAKKSESIPLEYRGNKIYKDGVEIDFEGIKALMGDHDNDIDLHADNDTIMRITAFAEDAIEFSTTYITGGKVYVDRVIINSDNDIKFDEIETGGGGGGKLYNTVFGTNTDGAPTQNAILSDIFGSDTSKQRVNLPVLKVNSGVNNHAYTLGIGTNTTLGGAWAVALGNRASTGGTGAVALGHFSDATKDGSISLGTYSKATSKGEVNIGSSNVSYGYDNTNYRLITGVHDPVNAQDAATKAYVDAVAGGPVLLTTAVENSNIMLKYNGSDISFSDIQEFIEAGRLVEIVHETIHYRLTYHAHNGIMFFTGLTPIANTTYQIYQLSIAYQGPATTASASFSKISFSVTQG